MNYYPFHIGDYLSATRHLSWEEDAAFRRLLDTYYTTEAPLPADHRACCRLVLATTESQREAVRVVLEEFFEATPEGWRNRRADAEIEAMRAKQERQREKANKRWSMPRTERGNASAMPRHTETDAAASKTDADAMPPTPTPIPIERAEDQEHVSAGADTRPRQPSRFDEFWTEYPRREAKKHAQKAWAKLRPDDALAERIIADLRDRALRHGQWLDGYIPHAATYINGRRWEDAIEPRRANGQPRAGPPQPSKTMQKVQILQNLIDKVNGHAAHATDPTLVSVDDPFGLAVVDGPRA